MTTEADAITIGRLSRDATGAPVTVTRSAEAGKAVRLSFPLSSEAPVERWFGTEVLSHADGAVRMDRLKAGAMPLLFNHDWNDPVGMIDGGRIEGGRMWVDAVMFATERAAEVAAMVEGGLRNVSVGYEILQMKEDAKRGVYTATDWMPLEASIVTVPADFGVGIGRQADDKAKPVPVVRAATQSQPAAPAAPQGVAMSADTIANTAGASADAGLHQPSQVPMPTGSNTRAIDMENARRQGIENLCKANGIDGNIRDHWIGTGLGLKEISDELLQIVEQRSANTPAKPATALGLSTQEAKRFSLFNAIRATADKNWTNAGFELECSREVAKKLNKVPDPNRFFVPFEVQERQVSYGGGTFAAGTSRAEMMAVARRDLTVASAGAGGYLVGTNNTSFIEMLRNRAIAYRAGARRLSGLTGSVTVPRQTAAATAYWLSSESTQITESAQTFTQMALSPKTVGAYTEISRQLLLQSSPDAEGIVTSDLSAVTALAYDLGVLEGSGSSGQPTGISATAGIGSVTGTDLAFADILEFQTDVATANVMPASGAYVTTPAVASLLIQRVKYSSTASPIWEGNIWDGMVQGYPAMSSNQLTAASMIFGDWSQVVVAEWGVLEVEVNPYANFQAGIIGVRAIVSMDVGLRYPAAFSRATSIT